MDLNPVPMQGSDAGDWQDLDTLIAAEDHWEMLLPSQYAHPTEDLDKLALFKETAGGGAALRKRRGEDLARAKVAAKQNQQRLEAAE